MKIAQLLATQISYFTSRGKWSAGKWSFKFSSWK